MCRHCGAEVDKTGLMQEGNGMLSDVERTFYRRYQPKEVERIVLIREKCGGAAVVGDFLMAHVEFLALLDPVSGKLNTAHGMISQLVPQNRMADRFGYPFEALQIYRLRLRCSRIVSKRQDYLLVNVREIIESEPQLEAVRSAYQQRVKIKDEEGCFTLNRGEGCFEGTVQWLGELCEIMLEVDAGREDTADTALAVMKRVLADRAKVDREIRAYAAEKLTDLANDWLDESKVENAGIEITKDVFAKRLCDIRIAFANTGSYTVMFNDDDMFWGHMVVVYVNAEGSLRDAHIEG